MSRSNNIPSAPSGAPLSDRSSLREREWLTRATGVLLVIAAVWALSVFARYALSIGSVRRHHVESALFVLCAACLLRLFVLPASGNVPADGAGRVPWIGASVTAAVIIVYWPTLSVGFLSDDFVLAAWARRGDFVGSGHAFVRPVPLFLWSLLLHAGGGAGSIHLLNVVLHAANGVLLVLLCRSFGLRSLESVLAGLLFVVWPTQVEAVAWVSAMSDVLATTLMLATVILFMRGTGASGLFRLAIAGAATAVALFTKETALAIAPILVVVAAWSWNYRPAAARRTAALAIPVLLCAIFLVWRVWIRTAPPDSIRPELTRYVVKEQISRTLGGLAVPLPADASRWIALLFGAAAVLLPVCAALFARQRRPAHLLACIGAVWTLVATAPAVGYLFVTGELEGSRYLYLAAVGWALLLASAWSAATADHARMRAVGGCAIVLLIVLSTLQSRRLVWNWQAAAAERDTILLKARSAASDHECAQLRIRNLPPTYHGAQLFRNGFDEAFASTQPELGGRRACDLRWDGSDVR